MPETLDVAGIGLFLRPKGSESQNSRFGGDPGKQQCEYHSTSHQVYSVSALAQPIY
jgi:hypothetical protein